MGSDFPRNFLFHSAISRGAAKRRATSPPRGNSERGRARRIIWRTTARGAKCARTPGAVCAETASARRGGRVGRGGWGSAGGFIRGKHGAGERVADDVGRGEAVGCDAGDAAESADGVGEAGFAVGEVYLGVVSGDDDFGVGAEAGEEHFDLGGGGVLGFVQDDEGAFQGEAAHEGEGDNLNGAASGFCHAALGFGASQQAAEGFVQGAEVGVDFLLHVAGEESQLFASGFNGGSGEDEARGFAASDGLQCGGDRQVGFADAGGSGADGQVVGANLFQIFALSGVAGREFFWGARGADAAVGGGGEVGVGVGAEGECGFVFGVTLSVAGNFGPFATLDCVHSVASLHFHPFDGALFCFAVHGFGDADLDIAGDNHAVGAGVKGAQGFGRGAGGGGGSGEAEFCSASADVHGEGAGQAGDVVVHGAAQVGQAGVVRRRQVQLHNFHWSGFFHFGFGFQDGRSPIRVRPATHSVIRTSQNSPVFAGPGKTTGRLFEARP